MSLADFLFAAKPAVGTPPFAPPHPNTGGANPPTTPDTLPVKRGLAGFMDRFLEPQNALGQFGRALVMAGGTPIGDAYRYMDAAKEKDAESQFKRAQIAAQMRKANMPRIEHVGDQVGIIDQNTGAFSPTYQAPQKEDPTIALARQYGATDGQIRDYVLGKLNNPIAVQGFDAEGRPTITFVPRSQTLGGGPPPPGALAPSPTAQPTSALDAITSQSESGGQRYGATGGLLTSPKGAMGEMQVMPSTARDPGFGVRPWDGSSPEDLARLGRDYRATMEKRYGVDLAKMWAAYNWGPGHLDKAIAAHGDNWLQAAPPETQKYIRKNLSAVGGGAAPAAEGVAHPKTRAEYDALPKGTRYVAPDGSRKVKS